MPEQLFGQRSAALSSVWAVAVTAQPLPRVCTEQHTVGQSHLFPFPAVGCIRGSKARPTCTGMQTGVCVCCPTPGPQLPPLLLSNLPSSWNQRAELKQGLGQAYIRRTIHPELPVICFSFSDALQQMPLEEKQGVRHNFPQPFDKEYVALHCSDLTAPRVVHVHGKHIFLWSALDPEDRCIVSYRLLQQHYYQPAKYSQLIKLKLLAAIQQGCPQEYSYLCSILVKMPMLLVCVFVWLCMSCNIVHVFSWGFCQLWKQNIPLKK